MYILHRSRKLENDYLLTTQPLGLCNSNPFIFEEEATQLLIDLTSKNQHR